MRESKECLECGGIYFRGEHSKPKEWEARKYCSVGCAAKAGRRAIDAKKQESEAETGKEGDPHFSPIDPAAPQTVRSGTELATELAPVMRELRIVRVGPNPRLVVCEYFELAQRRLCTVLVKRTMKFVRGMRFRMAEPKDESAYVRPWVYTGPAPRWKGRW